MKRVFDVMKLLLVIASLVAIMTWVKFEIAATTMTETTTLTIGAVHQAVNVNSIHLVKAIDKADGVLQDTDRVVLSIGGTSKIVRKAAQAQADYWDKNGSQSVELFKKANKAADGLNDVLGQAKSTLTAAEETTKQLQQPIKSVNQLVTDANKIVNDPNIPKAIDNTNAILANGKKITDRIVAPVTTVKKIGLFIYHSALSFFGMKTL